MTQKRQGTLGSGWQKVDENFSSGRITGQFRGMDAGGDAGLGNGHELQWGRPLSCCSVLKSCSFGFVVIVCQCTVFCDALYTENDKVERGKFMGFLIPRDTGC